MREYKNNIEPFLLDYMLCNEELERYHVPALIIHRSVHKQKKK